MEPKRPELEGIINEQAYKPLNEEPCGVSYNSISQVLNRICAVGAVALQTLYMSLPFFYMSLPFSTPAHAKDSVPPPRHAITKVSEENVMPEGMILTGNESEIVKKTHYEATPLEPIIEWIKAHRDYKEFWNQILFEAEKTYKENLGWYKNNNQGPQIKNTNDLYDRVNHALAIYTKRDPENPKKFFLEIWLPGKDGYESRTTESGRILSTGMHVLRIRNNGLAIAYARLTAIYEADHEDDQKESTEPIMQQEDSDLERRLALENITMVFEGRYAIKTIPKETLDLIDEIAKDGGYAGWEVLRNGNNLVIPSVYRGANGAAEIPLLSKDENSLSVKVYLVSPREGTVVIANSSRPEASPVGDVNRMDAINTRRTIPISEISQSVLDDLLTEMNIPPGAIVNPRTEFYGKINELFITEAGSLEMSLGREIIVVPRSIPLLAPLTDLLGIYSEDEEVRQAPAAYPVKLFVARDPGQGEKLDLRETPLVETLKLMPMYKAPVQPDKFSAFILHALAWYTAVNISGEPIREMPVQQISEPGRTGGGGRVRPPSTPPGGSGGGGIVR